MASGMISIDGSYGEGGGQVLRSALALSSILGRPFTMMNIRRNRKKPGLMPQHLTAVGAAKTVAAAEVTGDRPGGTVLTFIPRAAGGGRFSFATGTAGSTSLVLQTILPVLLFSRSPSSVTLTGGTHNPMSPSFHYLLHVFAPLLGKIGCRVNLSLKKCGFYPSGGGEIRAEISPAREIAPLVMIERGKVHEIRGVSAVGNLPESIAERQRQRAAARLHEAGLAARIDTMSVDTPGQGTFLFLEAQAEHSIAGFTSLGARGKPAEVVGGEGAGELLDYLSTGAALDPHAADQLVLYLAFCREKSVFTTSAVTAHLLTNLWLIEQFQPFTYTVEGNPGEPGKVTISALRPA